MEMFTSHEVYKLFYEAYKRKVRVSTIDTIHVSEVVGCLRKSYLARVRSLQVSPATIVKMLGDSIHKAIQEVLRDQGYIVEHKVSINDGAITLVGSIDAYNEKENTILEFKTVNEVPEEPYESHVKQAQIYMLMVRAEKGYIVYISRTNGGVRVFPVERDPRVLEWAMERARTLYEALKNNEAPAPEFSPLCNGCDFVLYCKGRKNRSS